MRTKTNDLTLSFCLYTSHIKEDGWAKNMVPGSVLKKLPMALAGKTSAMAVSEPL